jgi:hypothetical protein
MREKKSSRNAQGPLLVSLVGTLFLIISLSVLVIFAQQQQKIRSEAACASDEVFCSCTSQGCCLNACVKIANLPTGCNSYINAHGTCTAPTSIPTSTPAWGKCPIGTIGESTGCRKTICPSGDTASDGFCELNDQNAYFIDYTNNPGCLTPNITCGNDCCQIDYLKSGALYYPPSCNYKEINWICPTSPPQPSKTPTPTITSTPTPTQTSTPTPTQTQTPSPTVTPTSSIVPSMKCTSLDVLRGKEILTNNLGAIQLGDTLSFVCHITAVNQIPKYAVFKRDRIDVSPIVTEETKSVPLIGAKDGTYEGVYTYTFDHPGRLNIYVSYLSP